MIASIKIFSYRWLLFVRFSRWHNLKPRIWLMHLRIIPWIWENRKVTDKSWFDMIKILSTDDYWELSEEEQKALINKTVGS